MEQVLILSGQDEGTYGWVEANFLLKLLGLPASQTRAVIDMGGGSMQETFAVDAATVAGQPKGGTYLLAFEGGYNQAQLPDYNLYTHRCRAGRGGCGAG